MPTKFIQASDVAFVLETATNLPPNVAAVGVDGSADFPQLIANWKGTQVGHKVAVTLTGAAYAASTNSNLVHSKLTLTPTTSVTAANGLNAMRGEVNLTSGKTLGTATSYVSGVYGRANVFGTVDIGSGDLSAVYGKMDFNGSTLTSGHIAPVQANIVNPGASAATAGVSLFYGESASGTPIGNGIELYMAASYLLKLTNVSGSAYIATAAGATAGGTLKKLKVSIDGSDFYILAAGSYS